MKNLFSVTTVFFLICLSACADTPPVAKETNKHPAVSASNCEDIKLLLIALKEPDIFKKLPEEFLKGKDSVWSVVKNTTSDTKFGIAFQSIQLATRRGDWFVAGSLAYSIEENITSFAQATFNLNPSCFPKQGDVFTLAAKYFGKSAETPLPNKKQWLRNSKDQDEWWLISIEENVDSILLRAEITPAPTEESEE
jgi:hypothetical protein